MKYYGCFRYHIWNGLANSIHILNENSSHSIESPRGPVSFNFILIHPGKKQQGGGCKATF